MEEAVISAGAPWQWEGKDTPSSRCTGRKLRGLVSIWQRAWFGWLLGRAGHEVWRDPRPKGNWVPGRESFECPIKEFGVYPVGLVELLQQDRHLGQGRQREGKMVLTGKGGMGIVHRGLPKGRNPSPTVQLSHKPGW